jgi:hypothetical protein
MVVRGGVASEPQASPEVRDEGSPTYILSVPTWIGFSKAPV